MEILLPLCYNDKIPIDKSKFLETYDDIIARFNGCTIDRTPLTGGWRDPETSKLYEDENITFLIICEDTPNNREYLETLKQTLKDRFQQQELMMYLTRVERL